MENSFSQKFRFNLKNCSVSDTKTTDKTVSFLTIEDIQNNEKKKYQKKIIQMININKKNKTNLNIKLPILIVDSMQQA